MRTILLAALVVACAPDEEPAPPPEPTWCETQGWSGRPWDDAGPHGEHRHDLAADAEIPLLDDEADVYRLAEAWTGCETLVFVPDTIARSGVDRTSIWERDVEELLRTSPRHARWFFVSRRTGADAREALAAMRARVDEALANLKPRDRDWWADRVHVVVKPAERLDGWLGRVLAAGVGTGGLIVDRHQRLRGLGSLADVTRSNADPNWPWDNNLAMAVRDVRYVDALLDRIEALDAEPATEVALFDGEVIEQFADAEVTLPDAAAMAGFDTLEIVVDMRCPDPERPEPGNCGAWDYLAHLWLDEDGTWTELARFITSYHRETFWVFDATPMLPKLAGGGPRRFKWEWAPEWNVQPTETRLRLRFAKRDKGERPVSITRLFTGGAFGPAYNEGREPVSAAVPAGASRVELWALITGHGSGTRNCAEFCDHQHRFTVNGHEHLRTHDTVGEREGCVPELKRGMVPNQWGTWWFGRGGWCPGQQVEPWVVDVTHEVTPGQPATVTYEGLLAGGTPPEGAGDIVMNAWWVVYE